MKYQSLLLALTFFSTLSAAQPSVQLIRSATLLIHYNGQKILVDPMLSEKGTFQSFAGIAKNPTVDLTIPVAAITTSINSILVTHTHPAHFDKKASDVLDKSITLFHQPSDTDYFKQEQFKNATAIATQTEWNGIEIFRTKAQHGSGDILQFTGHASGFILKAKGQPTIYIIGDGIWTDDVQKNIQHYKPDYIIANTGGTSLPSIKSGPIIMNEEQTLLLLENSSHAKVIAAHMEALDHCSTTRLSLRKKANEAKIESDKLMIPEDGETIVLL